MARSLSALKAQLQRRVRDKTDGTIESADQTDLFNRAIDKLKSFHEFPGTKQRADIDVFDSVNEYATPTGYKSIIDFRSENNNVDWGVRTSREFWHDIPVEGNIVADDNYNETKILLINRRTDKGNIQVNNCDSLTANGTWAVDATTDATNLTADAAEKKDSSASLNFDIDVSASVTDTAAIQNSDMTAINLSGHEDKSTIFAWAFLPDVTNITSLDLRWGSSTSDYWSTTVTTAFNGTDFKAGWNRVGFAWDGATETGTPDSSAIDFNRYNITFAAAQGDDTDFRLDDIRSIMPERVTLNYYSTNFVKDADGSYETEFNDDDDTTILENFQDEILLYAALEEAFEILREFDDAARANNKFVQLLSQTMNDKPSEKTKPTDSYYYMASPNRRTSNDV